jgi:hypothetical protein
MPARPCQPRRTICSARKCGASSPFDDRRKLFDVGRDVRFRRFMDEPAATRVEAATSQARNEGARTAS